MERQLCSSLTHAGTKYPAGHVHPIELQGKFERIPHRLIIIDNDNHIFALRHVPSMPEADPASLIQNNGYEFPASSVMRTNCERLVALIFFMTLAR